MTTPRTGTRIRLQDVFTVKDIFQSDRLRMRFGNHGAEPAENIRQHFGQEGIFPGFDLSVNDMTQVIAVFVNHAVAGHMRTGIDA